MLVAIVGATGTGKSALSLNVAEAIAATGRAAEIVNADAMQLYRGMDIGTAKLALAERRGIPHHMLDVLDVTDDASVAQYQQSARAVIDEIESRQSIPLVVGGSGLYVQSLLSILDFPSTDADLRAELEQLFDAEGAGAIYARLHAVDPVAAENIGPHNGRRLVRALEVVTMTGEPFRVGLPPEVGDAIVVHVTADRGALVERLDQRVVGMWQAGMLTEVRTLVDAGLERGSTARAAIGYRQALEQLRGERDEFRAIAEAQALTRRFARRQVSWFRRYPATSVDGFDRRAIAEIVPQLAARATGATEVP